MSNNITRDKSKLGAGGDTTFAQYNSLSEITTINNELRELIDRSIVPRSQRKNNSGKSVGIQPKASTIPADEDAFSSTKRSPEDMVRQSQTSTKRRPLLDSAETIKSLKDENLKLKTQIYHMKLSSAKEIENFDIDGIKQDLVTDLLQKNDDLRKQLISEREKHKRDEEKRKNMYKDSTCQTNLDSLNIEELIKASVTLKRQKERQRLQRQESPALQHPSSQHYHQYQNQPQPHQQTNQNNQQQNHHYDTISSRRHDRDTQQPVISQLHYPHVTLPQPTSSGAVGQRQQMTPNEKQLLNELFAVDGILTTVYDKLRAVYDTNPD